MRKKKKDKMLGGWEWEEFGEEGEYKPKRLYM